MSRAPLERATVDQRRAGARMDDPLWGAPHLLPGIAIVLPCLDEEDNVAAAVSAATRAGERVASACEVIVVDDGSADATAAIAARLALLDRHVRLVRHERNRGYGAAVRTGIATARQPWVFLTDADLQFDLAELDRFAVAALGGGGAPQRPDLVIGWRVARSDPFARRVEAAAWNWLVRRLFALPFRDVDCAFKLIACARRRPTRAGRRSTTATSTRSCLRRPRSCGSPAEAAPSALRRALSSRSRRRRSTACSSSRWPPRLG
jgi:glycosyltransferase involved in cell wall biosynthesis